MTNRKIALITLSSLRENYSDSDILDYIMNNYLSGDEALRVMESTEKEFYQNGEDEFDEEDN